MQHNSSKILVKTHELAVDLIRHIKFDGTHPWHQTLVALYCTMIEYAGTALILIDETIHSSIPIILRSFIEAHVDFVNLSKDKRYGYHLEADALNEAIKLLRKSQITSNSLLMIIGSDPNTPDRLKRMENGLADLKKRSFAPLKIAHKFKLAGEQDVYESLYNQLCCESHNNLRALRMRHITINSKKKASVSLYRLVDNEQISTYSKAFAYGLVCDLEILLQTLHTEIPNSLTELKDSILKIK